jgi:hypothetical protein
MAVAVNSQLKFLNWPCFGQHLGLELDGQVAWRQHIDRHAQQSIQLNLKPTQVKQGGARQGIYQQIQIAAVCDPDGSNSPASKPP